MQAMVRQVVDIPVDQALYLEIIGQPHTRMGDAHGKTVLGLDDDRRLKQQISKPSAWPPTSNSSAPQAHGQTESALD
jgi:hypothetical protein